MLVVLIMHEPRLSPPEVLSDMHGFHPVIVDTLVRRAAILAALLTPVTCHAYIDPNAGGWLFQLLFPLLVAIGGAWMVLRQRISRLWSRLFKPKDISRDGN